MIKLSITFFSIFLFSSCANNNISHEQQNATVSAEEKEKEIDRLTQLAIRELGLKCSKTANIHSRVKKKRCSTKQQRAQAKLDAQKAYGKINSGRTIISGDSN